MDKVELIKAVRTATNCSLEDAKPLVELIWNLQSQLDDAEANVAILKGNLRMHLDTHNTTVGNH